MELVLLLSLLCTVVHGVDFDPESNHWIQGEYGSFSCSSPVAVLVTKNGNEVTTCNTDGTNFCPKPAPSYAKVTVTGNTLNFTILNLDRGRDTATWECNTDSTFIDVKIPVPNATIVNKNSLIFTDGQTTSITCKTGVSYPTANITWSIGGTNINSTATTTNNPDGTTTSILQYNAKKAHHNKTLQCSATNGYGSTKSDSITLNIRYSPTVKTHPVGTLYIIEGQQLELTRIGVDANPSVSSYTWKKDGVDIPGEQSSSFIITSVQKSDEGNYTCTATNVVGTGVSDNVQIRVGVPVPSVTIVNKNSLIFTDGQTISINGKTGVSDPHATFTWSVGGTTITVATTTNNSDGTTTSILQYNVKKTDHDKILKCSATNGFGSPQTDSITLLIRSKPELKNNASINRCLPATITVFAYPPPTCKWFINGQFSQDVSTVDSNGNEHTCKLSSDSEFNNIAHGDYYVNISNELGFTSPSFTVPDGIDIFPIYLLIVQGLRIVIVVLLLIIIIIGTGKGTNVTTIVSIITGVLIAGCVIILIYVLVHIKEVFWIIVSCLMVVFGILTAILIPIIHLLITKKVEDKNVKSVFWGLMVLSAVVILFSLALLIFICVILAQYDVCEKDYLIGGACIQGVDLLFTIGLTGLVYKKLGL